MGIVILDASASTVKKLAKQFDCTERAVRYALTFERNSEKAAQIRESAKKMGAFEIVMYPSGGWKTVHDEEGFINQYFPNGAAIVINKSTGNAELTKGGELVESAKALTMNGWTALIKKAQRL